METAGRLTILQAHNKRLTKVYERDRGRIVKRGYDNAALFTSRAVDVPSVDELADLLRRLQRHPDCCVIMAGPGKWHPGFGRPVHRRIYAAAELADDAGKFQKPARKGAGEVWQQREIEAGRLRPVTVLPAFEEQSTHILLLDFERITAPAGVEWRDDLAWTDAAMFVRRNRKLPSPDLIVVDESFWCGAVRHQRLALDRLIEAGRWRSRPRKGESPFKASDRLLEAEDFAIRVRNALQDGRNPRTVVTAEECGVVAAVEWGSRGGPGITPGMGYQAQQKAWSSWQRDECSKAGRFWNLLAAEHELPDRPMQRIVLDRDAATADGDRRHLIRMHYRRELHLAQVPVILLDADLDPVIAGKFFPALRMVEIPVRQLADIVQVVDRSCSMRFLLGGGDEADQQRADRRFAELERFAGRVLADGGLFVSYKDALDRVTLPAGVDAVHLGNLRGRDTYKHHGVAVIAGRLEPDVRALENRARAIFGDEAEAIVTVAAGDHGRAPRYPCQQRRYRVAGGAAGTAVAVAVHPDPRAQALLEQVRERELEQAVARLRLVHGREKRPATVYLLTNVPLNLEITELTTWNTLARDREAEACHAPGRGRRNAETERGSRVL